VARWTSVAAVTAVTAIAAGVVVVVARGGDPLRDPRSPGEAAVYAESLIGRVPLPRTAQLYTGPLPQGVLLDPYSQRAGDGPVHRHTVYRIDERPATLLGDLRARGIKGFNLNAYGESSVGGGPTTLAGLMYEEVRPHAGVARSELRVSGADPGVRPLLVRIDVEVELQPSRTMAEHVSTAETVITIERATRIIGAQPMNEHRVVTDGATVARLIRLFNALPATSPHTSTFLGGGCEGETAIGVTFARAANGRPDVAIASVPKCVSDRSPRWVFGVKSHAPLPDLLLLRGLKAGSAAARAERKRQQPSVTDPDGAFVRAVVEELQR